MKKKIVIIGISALAVILLLVFLTREKPLKISEEEAYAVLSDLVPKSYEVNKILFGEGLPYDENDKAREGEPTHYSEVKDGCGYSSVKDIKALAERVYSKQYLEGVVYVPVFEGVYPSDSDGMLNVTLSPRYKEIGGKLKIDILYPKLNIRDRLEVKTVKITEKTPKYVKLDTVCTENGSEIELSLFLTLENDVWLLDGPTY